MAGQMDVAACLIASSDASRGARGMTLCKNTGGQAPPPPQPLCSYHSCGMRLHLNLAADSNVFTQGKDWNGQIKYGTNDFYGELRVVHTCHDCHKGFCCCFESFQGSIWCNAQDSVLPALLKRIDMTELHIRMVPSI